MEDSSTIKASKLLICTTWTNLTNIMMSERSLIEKSPYCMVLLGQSELIHGNTGCLRVYGARVRVNFKGARQKVTLGPEPTSPVFSAVVSLVLVSSVSCFRVPCSVLLEERSLYFPSEERRVSACSRNNRLAFPFLPVLPSLSQQFLFWLHRLLLFGIESCLVSQAGFRTDVFTESSLLAQPTRSSH